jgi:hypothetical protein
MLTIVPFSDPLHDLGRARIGNAWQFGPRTTVPRGSRIGERVFPVEFPVEPNKQHRVVRLAGLVSRGGYARGLIVHFIPSR